MKWRDAEEKLNIWSRRNYLWLQNTGSFGTIEEGGRRRRHFARRAHVPSPRRKRAKGRTSERAMPQSQIEREGGKKKGPGESFLPYPSRNAVAKE